MVQQVSVAPLVHCAVGIYETDMTVKCLTVVERERQIVDQLLLFLCEF